MFKPKDNFTKGIIDDHFMDGHFPIIPFVKFNSKKKLRAKYPNP